MPSSRSSASKGRRAWREARRSACSARYFALPPLAFTSRQTVDGERCSPSAIALIERPAANPREISSRSSSESRSSDL